MRKTLTVVALLLIISGTFSYAFLYYNLNLKDPDNPVNTALRTRVLKYPVLRKALKLRQVGDARYEYMYHRQLPLEVYLYTLDSVSLEPETIETIQRQMQFATHKYAQITVHPPQTITGYDSHVSDEDVDMLLDTYVAEAGFTAKSVPLYIFVLDYYTPHPSYAGLVTDAHSLMLFKDAILNVSDTREATIAIEISTILHEFGHLGGAGHIENSDCIMADTVEQLNFFQKISDIRTSYCPEDIAAIQDALQ